MPIYIYVFIFFISLFLGSFYNVVALRTLSGENLAFPASHCTVCNHQLKGRDLVPVFSWTFLKGQCRYCKDPISPIYPFGELLTASAYTLIVWQFGFTWEAAIQIVFITVMIWATITDLKETMVPDRFVVIGLVLVGLMRLFSGEPIGPYLISSLLSFSVLFLILILSGGKMGGADVKLYALIGLAVGLSAAAGSLFYASFIGVLANLPMLLKKKESLEIPFVPFITLGVLLTYVVNMYSFLSI